MRTKPPAPTRSDEVKQPSGGAPVVLRGPLEITDPSQLAKLEKVTHFVGDLTLHLRGFKQPVKLPNLMHVDGNLQIANDTEVELANLKTVTQGLSFAGDMTLSRVALPKLETAGGIEIGSASYPLPRLKSLELPVLREVGQLSTAGTGLKGLSFPKLQKVSSLRIHDTPSLRSLKMPSMRAVDSWFQITNNPGVPAKDLRALRRQLLAAGVDPKLLQIDRSQDGAVSTATSR